MHNNVSMALSSGFVKDVAPRAKSKRIAGDVTGAILLGILFCHRFWCPESPESNHDLSYLCIEVNASSTICLSLPALNILCM